MIEDTDLTTENFEIDAEGKNFYFDVSQGPNMSQRGSKGSRMLLMHSNY